MIIPRGVANESYDYRRDVSIAKARHRIGYEPRYTSLQAVFESLSWLIEHGRQEGKQRIRNEGEGRE